ncbi:uncharacterized protein E2P81_ATG11288 [Venturia nashicola]|uniref:Uncharacterized protein n=1 Tax=Venturia nashicola TaxID=86259 RepID=A0A4Z1PBI2_9PEZI|nr:hypothetical protein E6O75_ATG10975 [Venturia nashicola]TLD35169.1 uncharacterized protein E2P81_ATG11288 [Venturia nashicola]
MSYSNTGPIRTLTNQLLDAVTKSYPSYYQRQDPTLSSFHNLPWLPTPPITSPHLEPVELPGSTPSFELPGSWPKTSTPELLESVRNVYADVGLTEGPPPYSMFPPSPTLSAMSVHSNESSLTMYSAKSHVSQSSQISQTSNNAQPSQTKPSLRRKSTPQHFTLRQLRAKESEAELRRTYEQQTDAYLEELFAMLGSPIERPLSSIRE